MSLIKKSFNLHSALAQRLDAFMADNPGLSFTLVMQYALSKFLDNPEIAPFKTKAEDLDEFLDENADLMEKLSE